MMWLVLAVGLVLGAGLALAFHARSRHAGAPAGPADGLPTMQACPACGSNIAVDWAFCPFCARAITQDEKGLPVAGALHT